MIKYHLNEEWRMTFSDFVLFLFFCIVYTSSFLTLFGFVWCFLCTFVVFPVCPNRGRMFIYFRILSNIVITYTFTIQCWLCNIRASVCMYLYILYIFRVYVGMYYIYFSLVVIRFSYNLYVFEHIKYLIWMYLYMWMDTVVCRINQISLAVARYEIGSVV